MALSRPVIFLSRPVILSLICNHQFPNLLYVYPFVPSIKFFHSFHVLNHYSPIPGPALLAGRLILSSVRSALPPPVDYSGDGNTVILLCRFPWQQQITKDQSLPPSPHRCPYLKPSAL